MGSELRLFSYVVKGLTVNFLHVSDKFKNLV